MMRFSGLAGRLGAMVCLGVCQVHNPRVSNGNANNLLNIYDMIAGENMKSTINAGALMETFNARVPADQLVETFVINCPGTVTHWQLAVLARTHDLTVVPVYGHAETISVAEGLVFESGRPVLLLPEVTVPEF